MVRYNHVTLSPSGKRYQCGSPVSHRKCGKCREHCVCSGKYSELKATIGGQPSVCEHDKSTIIKRRPSTGIPMSPPGSDERNAPSDMSSDGDQVYSYKPYLDPSRLASEQIPGEIRVHLKKSCNRASSSSVLDGWSTMDLTFTRPVTSRKTGAAPRPLIVETRGIYLRHEIGEKRVRKVSDLFIAPWMYCNGVSMMGHSTTSQDMMRSVFQMLISGDLRLVRHQACRRGDIVFDAPLPCYDRLERIPGAMIVDVPKHRWWQDSCKVSGLDMGPKWLVEYMYVPDGDCPNTLLFPTAQPSVYYTGAQLWVDDGMLDCCSAAIIHVPREGKGAPLYVHTVDLTTNEGADIFVDLDTLISNEKLGAKYHVVGRGQGAEFINERGAFETENVSCQEIGCLISDRVAIIRVKARLPLYESIVKVSSYLAACAVGKTSADLRALAAEEGSSVRDILCAAADPLYVGAINHSSGCYLFGVRGKERATIKGRTAVQLEPESLDQLEGAFISRDGNGGWRSDLTGEWISIEKGHMTAGLKRRAAVTVNDPTSRSINGPVTPAEHRNVTIACREDRPK